jgi:hypothetical protein
MPTRLPRISSGTRVVFLVVLAVLPACDDKAPTRPSPPAEPPAPAPVRLTRLEITGPDTVPPGESAQYSVKAYWSDGSAREVTSEAQWRTSDPSVLSVSPTGLATGHARGNTFIEAGAAGSFSSKEVIVLPAGLYRLIGTVRDAGLVVSGARVEVTAGIGRGLVATTSFGGYVLMGVAGEVEIRVTRNGFQEQRQNLLVTTHQTLNFDLVLSQPRADVAGTYTLRITADGACSAALPEEARSRNYVAVVTQNGPRVRVVLEGAKFFRFGTGTIRNSFDGSFDANQLRFLIAPVVGYYYYYEPNVTEELSPDLFFQFSGLATATTTSASITGTLNGRVETLRARLPGLLETASYCASSRHQFVLTR